MWNTEYAFASCLYVQGGIRFWLCFMTKRHFLRLYLYRISTSCLLLRVIYESIFLTRLRERERENSGRVNALITDCLLQKEKKLDAITSSWLTAQVDNSAIMRKATLMSIGMTFELHRRLISARKRGKSKQKHVFYCTYQRLLPGVSSLIM